MKEKERAEQNRKALEAQKQEEEKKAAALRLEAFQVLQAVGKRPLFLGKAAYDQKLQYAEKAAEEYDRQAEAAEEKKREIRCALTEAQVSNPWFSQRYNQEREKLFFHAMKLNKAFLLASKSCRDNLTSLAHYWGLQPGDEKERIVFHQEDREACVGALYQTLFLLVPVISTTFASVGTFLRDVKEQGSIGTLIVDEAGQAQSQMAAGALYRSRRAVIVGDPKQVEPVFREGLKCVLPDCEIRGRGKGRGRVKLSDARAEEFTLGTFPVIIKENSAVLGRRMEQAGETGYDSGWWEAFAGKLFSCTEKRNRCCHDSLFLWKDLSGLLADLFLESKEPPGFPGLMDASETGRRLADGAGKKE